MTNRVKKRLILIIALCLLLLATGFASTRAGKMFILANLTTESMVRSYSEPGLTDWRPKGTRRYSSNPSMTARPVAFGRALHTDIHGSDEVATVLAPMFEPAWTVETHMFVAEGPVFDSTGNIYFSPAFSAEPVLVVSLEPKSGQRRWAIAGESAGAGTPLILDDEVSGEERVYVVTSHRAVALDTGGNILWDTPVQSASDLNAGVDHDKDEAGHHCYGTNYHQQTHSLVAVMGNGQIVVLDPETGLSKLSEAFVLPGAPTAVTNFELPAGISKRANLDVAHMSVNGDVSADPVSAVLHAAAGELQKVTNFFSIDSNSGRLWVASTLPDAQDGNVDGYSDYAALYGLDLIEVDGKLRLKIAVVVEVAGGTASTPAISADGKRVYIADAFDSVYAIDSSDGRKIWSLNIGEKVAGSINVAADNGELYANTRTQILKLLDRGDSAELVWRAELDMYETGRFQQNIKSLGAEIASNGLAFTGAAGVVAGKQKFPFKLGAGLIDRETGKIRYFVDGAEDSVSSMVTGPDGGLYVGNSPLRRVLGRASFGKHVSPQPVVGGISRFRPIRHDLIVRDALWAASTRAANAASIAALDKGAAEADIFQIEQLINQARKAGPIAIKEGNLDAESWKQLLLKLSSAELTQGNAASLLRAEKHLNKALAILVPATPFPK